MTKCTVEGTPYQVLGYKGKQVRDNVHSGDLVAAFAAFFAAPRGGEVYIIRGGRASNCSMLEAIELSRRIAGRDLSWSYSDDNRVGDHIWWISDVSRFASHYPQWRIRFDVPAILREIHQSTSDRRRKAEAG